MSVVTGKEAFPKTHSYEQDGWEMTVRCTGVYTEFVMGFAQAGDPKGSVTLKGHGMEVSVGTACSFARFPANLSHGRELIEKLGCELINRYNMEPDWGLLRALGRMAFVPFRQVFSI